MLTNNNTFCLVIVCHDLYVKRIYKVVWGADSAYPYLRVTSIEADFACNAYSKHTCKVHVRPSRELVHFKKCFSAFSSNTPGQHCRKKNVQTRDSVRTCTLELCLLYALQAKSASIDVTNSDLSGRGLLLNL